MKKIIFIRSSNSAFGGAEIYLQNLVELAKKHNIDCEVFSSGDYGQSKDMRPKIFRFLPNFLRTLLFLRAYKKMLKRVGVDNVVLFSLERVPFAHIYRAGDGIHSQWLGIKADGKIINKLKIGFNPQHILTLLIECKLLQNTPCILANSNFIKQSILKRYNREAESIEVVYNGVEIPNQIDKISAKKEIYQYIGIADNSPIISFVGSGYARKGVGEALQILSNLKNKAWVFIVIGKEKKLSFYKNLAKKIGIENRVYFLGAMNNKETKKFLEGSDIFLMPTHYEPCSNATLEAMSYGNAVVTTRQNGASEIMSNKSAVLETPHDFTKALAILNFWLSDSELLKQAQMRNIEDVAPFSRENNLKATLNVIEKWINKL